MASRWLCGDDHRGHGCWRRAHLPWLHPGAQANADPKAHPAATEDTGAAGASEAGSDDGHLCARPLLVLRAMAFSLFSAVFGRFEAVSARPEVFCFMIMTVWAMLLVEWVHPCVRDMYDQGFFRECGDQCLRSTQSAPSFMDLFRALFQRNRWFWMVLVCFRDGCSPSPSLFHSRNALERLAFRGA